MPKAKRAAPPNRARNSLLEIMFPAAAPVCRPGSPRVSVGLSSVTSAVGLTTVTDVIVLSVPSGRVVVLRVVLLVGARVVSSSEVVFSDSVVDSEVVVVDEVDDEELGGRVWVWKLLVVGESSSSSLVVDEVDVG